MLEVWQGGSVSGVEATRGRVVGGEVTKVKGAKPHGALWGITGALAFTPSAKRSHCRF